MLFKKWEKDILFKAKYGYDVDYETKRIAHLILDREDKLLKKHLDALESKEIALAEELARIRHAKWWLKYKKDKYEEIDVNL